MAYFGYLWDKTANLLLVAAPVGAGIGILRVEQQLDAGRFKTLGYGLVGSGDAALPWFTTRLPNSLENENVVLSIQGLHTGDDDDGYARQPPISERIILDTGRPVGKCEELSWLIERDGERAELFVWDPTDHESTQMPTSPISSTWVSRREGESLFPAERIEGDIAGATLKVMVTSSSTVNRANDEDGVEEGNAPEISLTISSDPDCPIGGNTTIEAFSLSAQRHVLPLLAQAHPQLRARNNRGEVSISAKDLGEEGCAELDFPSSSSSSGANEDSAPLGYLDRIVLKSTPPAKFLLDVGDFSLSMCGRNGAVVLVHHSDGYFQPDDGGVLRVVSPDLAKNEDGGAAMFQIEMSKLGRRFNHNDLTMSGEIISFAYSEVRSLIDEIYGAAASRLQPRDVRAFLEAPSFYCLLASLERLEEIGLLVEALRSISLEDGEDRLAAQLALAALDAPDDAEDFRPENERYRHWIARMETSDDPWLAVSAVLHPGIRKGVEAGLTPIDSDIGIFLEYLDRAANASTIDRLRELNNDLSDAGVLSMTFEQQFVSPNNARERVNMLDRLRKDALEVFFNAERQLGVFDGHTRRDDEVLRELRRQDITDRRVRDNRAVAFFQTSLRDIAPALDLANQPLDIDAFHERAAGVFFSHIESDCDMISSIVACGYADPIALPAGEVINLGFGERRAEMFRPPLRDEQRLWIFDDTGNSLPIVEQWRKAVRNDYETYHRDHKAVQDR